MIGEFLLIGLAFVFVFLNGFFVATEFAIVKLRPSRVQALLAKGHPSARLLLNLTENVDEYLSACQLGITLASLGLGWIGEPTFAKLIAQPLAAIGLGHTAFVHSVAVVAAFTLITALHIVFGELAPKSLAIQSAEKVAMVVARPMALFYRLAYPAIRILNVSGNWVVRSAGLPPASDHGLVHTEEELKLILRDSHKSGILTKGEKDLMDNVFEFADRRVRQVMVPRGEIACFDLERPLEENLDVVRETGYTRYPLCEGDIDHTIGMIHVKDLLLPARPLTDSKQLVALKRKLLFVPEMISIQGALNEMRKEQTLLAMVVDEYGVVSGLVTLEDIIEELVGEIQDEFDQEHALIHPTKDGGYLVDGMVPIEDIREHLGIDVIDDENDTISGHILSQLGRVADVGDVLQVGGYSVRVLQLSGLRIAKLLWTKKAQRVAVEEPDPSRPTTVADLRTRLRARRERLKEIKSNRELKSLGPPEERRAAGAAAGGAAGGPAGTHRDGGSHGHAPGGKTSGEAAPSREDADRSGPAGEGP